ncbi:hypothetical protein NDU88_008568 [Pleurodeles waltl]|uniref:Uncharacterized protein n=1 Tax=Pleurodeles waltl TaxID=8319 RepID=A0AAV7PPH5_PLEWA|nr:hypothetical protein NDU88_008568 [Pleurodeles waltl]
MDRGLVLRAPSLVPAGLRLTSAPVSAPNSAVIIEALQTGIAAGLSSASPLGKHLVLVAPVRARNLLPGKPCTPRARL